MEILYISNLLSSLSLALLAVSPTVFIFSVTLLGTAIEQAQQEEKAARENDKANLQKEIDEIEKNIKQVRKDGDTSTLTNKLGDLKRKQTNTEEKIKEIKVKYSSIDLTNCVLYPCAAFFIVTLVNPLGVFFQTQFFPSFLLISSETLLIVYGVLKIYRSLLLVQEISANKKESEGYSRLKDNIKLALQEYDQGKKEEVSVEFVDKAFPLNTTISTELTIQFRLKLVRGNVLNNVCVWFFVANGLDLLDPKEEDAWKQASDYDPPNIRTVKIIVGTLSTGPYKSSSLKVKTPPDPGKYLLRYKVYADGFSGPSKDLSILVG